MAAVVALTGLLAGGAAAQSPASGEHPALDQFFLTMAEDDDVARAAIERIGAAWRDGYAGMLWDMMRFMTPPTTP